MKGPRGFAAFWRSRPLTNRISRVSTHRGETCPAPQSNRIPTQRAEMGDSVMNSTTTPRCPDDKFEAEIVCSCLTFAPQIKPDSNRAQSLLASRCSAVSATTR